MFFLEPKLVLIRTSKPTQHTFFKKPFCARKNLLPSDSPSRKVKQSSKKILSYPQLTNTITAQKKVSEEKTTKMNVKTVDVNDDAVAAPAAASAAAAPHPAVAAASAAAASAAAASVAVASTAAVASAVAMAAAGDGGGVEPSKNGNGKSLFSYIVLLNTFLSFLLINNYSAIHACRKKNWGSKTEIAHQGFLPR